MPTPNKQLGQHFLSDQGVIQHIVCVLDPRPGEHLVEIGPGQGAITLPVLKLAHELDAIEFDRGLIPELCYRSERAGQLNIYNKDVLKFDFAQLRQDERLLRVFGNLPYNISTPLLFHVIDYASIIKDMTFMLQKEVGHRLAATPSSDSYGRLSVMVQYHCQVECLFDISPAAFYPPPQVQSTMVRLIPYRTLPFPAKNYKLFESIVRDAFGQRRKTLRNSLKKIVPDGVWQQLAIDPALRPENLGVEAFVTISNTLS